MKVKINVDRIYETFNPAKKFKYFIEENRDKIFTAVPYSRTASTTFYTLKEDKQDPPWIFDGRFLEEVEKGKE